MLQGKIAVASGKGGTGKTTVALNLASVCAEPVTLLDCDVEEPNLHLFVRPEWEKTEPCTVLNPYVNEELCDGCGECKVHCRFNAIGIFGGKPLFFPELCHSCGACSRVCTRNAICEEPRAIGRIRLGMSGHIKLVQGELNVGEAKSPPLIEAVRRQAAGRMVIIDAPPGTSCPVLAAVNRTDYVVLVTEPTPFGLNDLRLAVQMLRILEIPCGVVINRSDCSEGPVHDYLAGHGVALLAEIPCDMEVAALYARGEIPSRFLPDYRQMFAELLRRLQKEMAR